MVRSVSFNRPAGMSVVPQGSMLGQRLFLIYVNTLNFGLFSGLSEFADVTKRVIATTDPQTMQDLRVNLPGHYPEGRKVKTP